MFFETLLDMIDSYYKFTMVRNPFERLLSGYRDKGWTGFFPEKVYKKSFTNFKNVQEL